MTLVTVYWNKGYTNFLLGETEFYNNILAQCSWRTKRFLFEFSGTEYIECFHKIISFFSTVYEVTNCQEQKWMLSKSVISFIARDAQSAYIG